MNAPFHAAVTTDWRLTHIPGRLCVDDPRAMKLAAKLAAAILHPLAIVEDFAYLFPDWSETTIRKMAAHRHFARALQRAVAQMLDWRMLRLTPEFFDRLVTTASARLCVLLLTEPLAAVRAAALDLAIAIAHRRVLRVVLKQHRAKLRAAIGEDGLRLGAQEAPMLYPRLAEVDLTPSFEESLQEHDPSMLQAMLVRVGMSALFRFVEFCEPELGDMFVHRMPAVREPVGPLTEAHCDQIVRLFRRRAPSWSATIG